MASLLYVRGASGDVAVPDLGVTIAQGPSWTLLAASSPADADGSSGQFSAREIRDSADLYALVTAGTLEWSKNGSDVETAGDYVADFLLMQDFSDDHLDLTDGTLTVPNDTDAPAEGQLGNIFWDTDNKGLYMYDGDDWLLIATHSGVNVEHGLLEGLDDDDHEQYLLLDGNDTRNAVTGSVDFSSASGLVLPTGTDQTGLLTSEGSIMWDTDDDELWIYDGSDWVNIGTAIASGVLDHGILTGLDDDDHTQYLTEARHDALAADNPHSVTFTQAVTADGNTDITAAEAETLTDGSNADLLHTHDYAATDHDHDGVYSPVGHNHDHGSLTGLEDDDHPQYTAWDDDETVSGVWTFATDTNEPAFVITPDTSAPSTKLADGAIAIIDGLLSVYDNGRSKWLSVDRGTFEGGRRGAATNIFLRVGADDVPSNVSGYVMPRNGTITALFAGTESNATWTFEVWKNGVQAATLGITAASTGQATDTNVDFSAGDVLSFYCNGTAVPWPVGGCEVAWREAT